MHERHQIGLVVAFTLLVAAPLSCTARLPVDTLCDLFRTEREHLSNTKKFGRGVDFIGTPLVDKL